MAKQCPTIVYLNTCMLVCILDEKHEERHKDFEGGTWRK